jgi:cell division septation protein DedD
MRRSQIALRFLALGLILLTAACGGGRNQAQMAQDYARHSRYYTPPGPPHDPWGPYIQQAASEFDVPERWIREVMRVESGGRQDAVSPVGAMGLVQVMPATYEELRGRYSLGDDPFHPRDNIRAGAAYMREMYDRFGSPGFLAAYNAGPRGLERWLYEGRPLPNETRNYVAMIAPRIRGIYPVNQVSPHNLAMVPETIGPGPRYASRRGQAGVMMASARQPAGSGRAGTQVAAMPIPPARSAPAAQVVASAPPPPAAALSGGAPSSRFSLIPSAHAATMPRPAAPGPSRWAVQVGAFASESLARSAAVEAKGKARDLAGGLAFVQATDAQRNRLYRARIGGLSRDAAADGCEKLRAQRWQCTIISPDAQS